MRRSTPLLAVLFAMAALVGACSQQKDPKAADLRKDISEELQELEPNPLSKAQADCYAELLVEDEADAKLLADVRFSDAEPPAEDGVRDKIAAAAIAAREDCDIAEAPR